MQNQNQPRPQTFVARCPSCGSDQDFKASYHIVRRNDKVTCQMCGHESRAWGLDWEQRRNQCAARGNGRLEKIVEIGGTWA